MNKLKLFWFIFFIAFVCSCKENSLEPFITPTPPNIEEETEEPELIVCDNLGLSKDILEAPDYDTFVPPAAGQSFHDPVFCTEIIRLTDDQSITGSNGERAMFSPDDKYFVVMVGREDDRKMRLFDGVTGAFIEDFNASNKRGHVFRWSREDHLMFPVGNELREINVLTKEETVLYTFEKTLGQESGWGWLAGGDGNDFDDNKEWIMLSFEDIYFAFNIKTKEKGPEKDLSDYGVDYLTISPSGKYIIGDLRDISPQKHVRWDKDWQNETAFFPNSCHSDLYQINGVDYFLGKRGHKDQPESWLAANNVSNKNSIVSVRVSDGKVMEEVLPLTQYGEQMFSAVGGSGNRMAVVAIESNGYSPGEEGWGVCSGEIVLLGLDDNTVTRRLVHHRARPSDSNFKHIFNDQPEAWINHAGTRVFFRSNMANYTEEGKNDLYMIKLD